MFDPLIKDDMMPWYGNDFRITVIMLEIHRGQWWYLNASFEIFFAVCQNKLLNK